MSFHKASADTTVPDLCGSDRPELHSLSYAEHFCLWSIRTTIACTSVCRAMLREFHTAFDEQEVEAHAAFRALLQSFGGGRRPVRIGRPGHIQMTPDEVCLLELLRAAQHEDQARFDAYACWLMGGQPAQTLYETAHSFTAMLRERGHGFRKPVEAPVRVNAQAAAKWVAQRQAVQPKVRRHRV